MRTKRSTFRRRRNVRHVNTANMARRSIQLGQRRALIRVAALKKPGAKIAASEVIGAAMCRRERRGAKRRENYHKGLLNYHRDRGATPSPKWHAAAVVALLSPAGTNVKADMAAAKAKRTTARASRAKKQAA